MTTKLEKIKLENIYPTGDNKRSFDPSAESFRELKESIRAKGQKVPGIGRPHPDIPGAIDLRAGRRRFEALREIGDETMDVLIRDMTDAEAVEETVLENFREDLTPYEEAASVGELLRIGHTRAEVADLLGGKSEAWVTRRCNLLKLDAGVVFELEKGCGIEPTTAALEVLSRYDGEIQGKVLRDLVDNHAPWDCEETGVAVKITEKLMIDLCYEYHQDLGTVQWDLDDEDLYKPAGACSSCPKRSSCEPMLFTPEELGDKKNADICLDNDCFNRKRAAHFKRVADDVSEKAGKAPVLLTDLHQDRDRLGDDVTVGMKHEYEKAKKTDPGAIPAIDVMSKGQPRVQYVKPRDYASGLGSKMEPKTLKQKQEELQKKRELFTVHLLHEAFSSALLADLVPVDGFDTRAQLLALALSFKVGINMWVFDLDELQEDNDVWINSDDHGPAYTYLLNDERLLAAAWISVRSSIVGTIARKGPVNDTHTDEYIEHAKFIASLIDWNWEKGAKEAAEQLPEPKAWSKQAAA